jgi:uncharacterized protein (TIGR02569 family)
VVLKPGHGRVAGEWQADLLGRLGDPGFRVPEPVRATDGSWIVAGWAASSWVDGVARPLARWPELVRVIRSFHAALVGVAAPPWLGRAGHQWAVADRVAWGEADVTIAPELADLVTAVRAAMRPVALPAQLVHGDIAGNVLFADGQVPAVIDFSPYWRPAGYASAIAAVDVLLWSAGPATVLDELVGEPEIDQLLLRALVFRMVVESIGRPDAESRLAARREAGPVVELLLARVAGRPVSGGVPDERAVGALAGRVVTGFRPVAGGHSRAVCRVAECADGGSLFVKSARGGLGVESAVYSSLAGRSFVPSLVAADGGVLVTEALSPDGWVGEWTPELVAATRDVLGEVHGSPVPVGVPAVGVVANAWVAIAADPVRLSRFGVCGRSWLDGSLDVLRAAAGEAPTAGDCLVHRDVCAANLWSRDGRVVLVDWSSAGVGDPWFDVHLWLVALHAEGGPPPEVGQGSHAAAQAALIAGLQVLLAPARDADPVLFELRRRRLVVALSWAARLLGLPSPA